MTHGNSLKRLILIGLMISLMISFAVGDGYQFTYKTINREIVIVISAKSVEQWALLSTLVLSFMEMYSKKLNS